MKNLIVNADDLGWTEGVNRGIAEAHAHGIVTSTSLLANGGAFVSGVELALSRQGLGVGVHLNLSDGAPLAAPELVTTLLNCQTPFSELCNADELQFQVVHQIEELWMKLIAYTLLDIDEYLQAENTNRVITLFRRVHLAQKMMIQQVGLLETMSPKEYQAIRMRLGNGSGQESPGFRTLLRMYQPIWNCLLYTSRCV